MVKENCHSKREVSGIAEVDISDQFFEVGVFFTYN